MITADQPFATHPNFIVSCFCFLLLLSCFCSSQKTCPNCGSIQVPYPLSTHSTCGDPNYHLRCDSHSQKLYFDAMNGSSYLVLRIMGSFQRMVVQPSPWVPASSACVTQDMVVSEGLRLNQTLPFNLTFSNTIFLYNCSPRLLLAPLNCTPSSLCHRYLESSGHVDKNRALKCAGSPDLSPCCTFVAGGMPSAYRIRLHDSGCKAFRSILNLDPEKPASQWEEGLEIQWASPPEPICNSKLDCSGPSKCSPAGRSGLSRCLCNRGYYWDHVRGTCLRNKHKSKAAGLLGLEVSIGVICFISFGAIIVLITVRKSSKRFNQAKLDKAREDMLKSSDSGKNARMFQLKEVKKATNGFSQDRILGSGGFGEVYKELLTSQKAIDFSRDQDDVNLAIYVSQAAKKGAIMEVVDQRLIGTEPSSDVLSSVELFSELAFACLREKKADRPSMREVVQQLERMVKLELEEISQGSEL
ncbi:hypothetical protein D5086_012788 [Populus alba]|uniref:Uncharacterized protein n=1 Tax=Populus alba TaxID=43335 RepID=A0ACC4C3X2_POPAL